MASIEEVLGGIMSANNSANEAVGHVSRAHDVLETAQRALMHATEGSPQSDVSRAVGLLGTAIDEADKLRYTIAGAIGEAEAVAGRL